jgi:hypothetical protein
MDDEIIGRFLQVSGKHLVCCSAVVCQHGSRWARMSKGRITIGVWSKLYDIANANIDNTQEALVLLLELLLIKNLNRQDAVLIYFAAVSVS